jgi:NADPH2:quinone reductase
MRAGWYERQGPPAEVLIDAVGAGVDRERVGDRVWCFGAQSYRPSGTAAEYTVVPEGHAVPLPADVSFDQGACLGIPGITAHRAVFCDGPVSGQVVLVAGAAGAVGSMAADLAAWDEAFVVATVRSPDDGEQARRAGADEVVVLGEADDVASICRASPAGVDRIVEVALGANAALDARVITQGGVIAAYASDEDEPRLPFWPLLFRNATIRLLGSDDFAVAEKEQAAADIVAALEQGRLRAQVGARFPLEQIAAAHEAVEQRTVTGRVVVAID